MVNKYDGKQEGIDILINKYWELLHSIEYISNGK